MEGEHHVVKKQTSVRLPFSNNEADLILLPICSSLIAHNSTLGNGFPTWENMMFTCNNNNIRSNTRLIIMYIIRFENLWHDAMRMQISIKSERKNVFIGESQE